MPREWKLEDEGHKPQRERDWAFKSWRLKREEASCNVWCPQIPRHRLSPPATWLPQFGEYGGGTRASPPPGTWADGARAFACWCSCWRCWDGGAGMFRRPSFRMSAYWSAKLNGIWYWVQMLIVCEWVSVNESMRVIFYAWCCTLNATVKAEELFSLYWWEF